MLVQTKRHGHAPGPEERVLVCTCRRGEGARARMDLPFIDILGHDAFPAGCVGYGRARSTQEPKGWQLQRRLVVKGRRDVPARDYVWVENVAPRWLKAPHVSPVLEQREDLTAVE